MKLNDASHEYAYHIRCDMRYRLTQWTCPNVAESSQRYAKQLDALLSKTYIEENVFKICPLDETQIVPGPRSNRLQMKLCGLKYQCFCCFFKPSSYIRLLVLYTSTCEYGVHYWYVMAKQSVRICPISRAGRHKSFVYLGTVYSTDCVYSKS